MKKILFSLLFAILSFTASAQLAKFKQVNSTDSIGLNVNDIWKAQANGNDCKVTIGTAVYDIDATFAQVVAACGGALTQFDYITGTTTRTFALNKAAVAKAFKVGSNSKVVLKNGKVFDLDATFASLFDASSSAVTEFTSFDTIGYVVPQGAKALQIICVGGGGGGGSGRRGAAFSPRAGGSGGGGGAYSEVTVLTSDLTLDTLIIMIGKGGIGGDSVVVNSTNGNAGAAGVESKVLNGASVIVKATGGSGGAAGTAVPVAGGAGGTIGDLVGSAGGGADTTAVGTVGVSATTKTTGGGGGGGALGHLSTARAGGVGGAGFYGLQSGGAANTAATALTVGRYVGGGGGGGTSHASNAGGSGGAGVAGGGGGGGAASTNGAASGRGGNGGDGYVRIVPIF